LISAKRRKKEEGRRKKEGKTAVETASTKTKSLSKRLKKIM
jgi:hypothetical protein